MKQHSLSGQDDRQPGDLTGRASPRSKSGSGQRGQSAGSGQQLHSSKSVDYGNGRGDHHGHGGMHGHRPESRQAQVGLKSRSQLR